MRDPDRIPSVLAMIETLWEKYPDMRLGQLILNAVQEPQLYGIEDDVLVARLFGFYDDLEIRLEK